MLVIAHWSGMSCSNISMNLSKNQVTESTEAPTSLKATTTTKKTKVGEGPTECVNRLLMTQINDKAQEHIHLCTLIKQGGGLSRS